MGPLLLFMAAYNFRRAALDAQSMAMRWSPFGVDTLEQPVSSAQSVVSYFYSSSFHSSTLP
jgi:hypothetical protein